MATNQATYSILAELRLSLDNIGGSRGAMRALVSLAFNDPC